MIDTVIQGLALGFDQLFSADMLLVCFAGVLAGTLVGVLPGFGPIAAVSLLLPFMFFWADQPTMVMIFLSAIYYGSQFGASISAILLKMPGDAPSIMTALDGYAMSQQGRAGAALSISATASFLGGVVGTLVLAGLAVPMSEIAFLFGPAEFSLLLILALTASVAILGSNAVTGMGMVLLGSLLGLVGTDLNSGVTRFTLHSPSLADGISFAVMAVAVFGLSSIIYEILKPCRTTASPIGNLMPNNRELCRAVPAAVRGTGIGCLIGLLPGGGSLLSSFGSYALEKRLCQQHADPACVAGPEAANNSGAHCSYVPMLALGIPTNAVTALVLGALVGLGLQPGPDFVATNQALFWALIASMLIGNVMLLIVNLPLIRYWVWITRLPLSWLLPMILAASVIGIYLLRSNMFDVWLLIPFTLLGLLLRWCDVEPAPMALGFILSPMLEENFRRALAISQGEWTTFVASPISLLLIGACGILLVMKFARISAN